jgi:O-antigen/teichoic acid export membrane protein
MLKLILRQTNWGILGAVFGFSIGFFVKIYLLDIVGLDAWGKYVAAQTFVSFVETVLSIGIPYVIIKFIPNFVDRNQEKASRIANIFLKYALVVGLGFLFLNYFFSPYISKYIYTKLDNFSTILFLMSIHVPITLLFGVIISLYRSMLKIKEIVLYGTVVAVIVRAVLTFVVFQFTSDISYFIFIEIFTQILVLSILLFLFDKNQFPLFVKSKTNDIIEDDKMLSYGKKMFFNSIVAFVSGQSLSFIISIKLASVDVGAYNILLTLAGLSTFLLINLNKVFAPAISKLYHDRNFKELNDLYKKTTFLINLCAIPLVVNVAIFADEILGLYTVEMLVYKEYLFYMLAGGMLSLAAGSSGTFMIMAGLEKQNLKIQFIRAIMLILLSLWLIPLMGLKIVVILYVLAMLFVNLIQVFYIYTYINISPFSKELIILFIATIFIMYFAMNQNIHFSLSHFFIIPIFSFALFFSIMFKSLKRLLKDII